jgi:hypothetical protein
VHMTLDTLDALHLDDTLSDLATSLRQLGDTDTLDVRRAKAVGVLADPQRAIDLLAGHRPDHKPGGRVELFVHVDSSDLADPERTPGHIERLGAATADLIRDWLGRPELSGVTIRPVLDLHRADAVDRHDPPGWMRTGAVLGDATCVFPGCQHDSRGCDLDHIEPYRPPPDGGLAGQTWLANLAPLCRTHHRLKTHAGWHYARLDDNQYLWTTPAGDLIAVRTRRRRT